MEFGVDSRWPRMILIYRRQFFDTPLETNYLLNPRERRD